MIRNVHKDPGSSTHCNLYRDLAVVLVLCFCDVEHGEDGGGNDEQCRVHEVTSRTDPPSDTECEGNRRIVLEASILVEKSLWFKFFRIWVCLWVVQNCPEASQMNAQT